MESQIKPIDIGLSVLWGDRNIGASSILDKGYLFNWGTTKYYSNLNVIKKLSDGSSDSKEKYEYKLDYKLDDILDDNDILKIEYDPARLILGYPWRLPTYDESSELFISPYIYGDTCFSQEGIKFHFYMSNYFNTFIIFPFLFDYVSFWTSSYNLRDSDKAYGFEYSQYSVYSELEKKSISRKMSIRPVIDRKDVKN